MLHSRKSQEPNASLGPECDQEIDVALRSEGAGRGGSEQRELLYFVPPAEVGEWLHGDLQSSSSHGDNLTHSCRSSERANPPLSVLPFSPRRGRRRKAWGFNPRNGPPNNHKSPEGARAANVPDQAACAPSGLLGEGWGAYLGLKPQALR